MHLQNVKPGTKALHNFLQVTDNRKTKFNAKMYGLQIEPCTDVILHILVPFCGSCVLKEDSLAPWLNCLE